ncbi:MAG TPA: hypothetical protein VKV21_15680 [Solirubrobacteraceae bacterium]|nr:hypothetical protein [Solirubrobacteraceae bacterium]
MRRPTTLLTSAAVIGACGVCAAQAAAAPTAATLPSISGSSAYGSTLTCNNGTWSAGAGSFTYAWQLSDGGVQIGTAQTLRVRAIWVGLGIQCTVTATDTSGSATVASASVTATPQRPSIRITAARQIASGKIVIQGTISPLASLKGGAASLILYRQTKAGPQQLSFNGSQTRPNQRTGRFRMTATGEPTGRNKYILQYVPSASGYSPQITVRRTITVR